MNASLHARTSTPRRRLVGSVALVVCAAACFAAVAGADSWKRDRQPPSTPSDLRATSATVSSITFAWTASTDNVGVTGYEVSVGSAATSVRMRTLSYTVSGLACGTSVTISVVAFDRAGNRSTPATATASTSPCPTKDTTPPSTPTDLAASAVTPTGMTLSWTASKDDVGVTGYDVYQGPTHVALPPVTGYVLTGLSCGTTYTVYVDAFDAAGNTSPQASLTAKTAACPTTTSEPVPIAGLGYHQVFRDDFNGTALDTTSWNPKEFWESVPRPGAVVVSDGTVKVNNLQPYIDDQSISTGPYWGGEAIKHSWMFGYFEARMKFTDARGSWPAFWLESVTHSQWDGRCPEPNLNFELDIMEYQGDEPSTFYGSEHRNTNGYCGASNPARGVITQPKKLGGDWHTYAVKWTATDLTWYVDDVQQGLPQALFDSGAQQMFMTLTMQACGWDSSNSCTTVTPSVLVTEVDYVRVWQQ
jgi:beta-glucanase (GH16 family)